MPQSGGIIAVLVAGRDHQQAEADDVGEAVPDLLWRPRVIEAGGQAIGDAEAALDLFQRQHAAIGGEPSAIKAGDQGFAQTADRPGSGGVCSTLAGMVSASGCFECRSRNLWPISGLRHARHPTRIIRVK